MSMYALVLCLLGLLVLSPTVGFHKIEEKEGQLQEPMEHLVADEVEKLPYSANKPLHSTAAVCIITGIAGVIFVLTCYYCVHGKKNKKMKGKRLKKVKTELLNTGDESRNKRARVRTTEEQEALAIKIEQLKEFDSSLNQRQTSWAEICVLTITDCGSIAFIIIYKTCKKLSGSFWGVGLIGSIAIFALINVYFLFSERRALAPRDALRIFLASFIFVTVLIRNFTVCMGPQ